MTKKKKEGERGELSIILVIILLVAAVFFGGYELVGWISGYAARKIPDKIEMDLFGSLGSRQLSWQKEPKDERQRAAERIFAKLAKGGGLRDLRYELFFTPDSSPNAFALPGGSVAVTEGLLTLVEGEIGRAMVLGHELGHLQHRHSLQMMGRTLLVGTILALVVGDTGFILGTALDLVERSHSREQELEADAFGIQLVHRSFGTTDGALEFFEKLTKEGGALDNKLFTVLSTHPFTPDRIDQLKSLQMVLEPKGPTKSSQTKKAAPSPKGGKTPK